MSKKSAQTKEIGENEALPKKEIVYVRQNNYLVNVVLFCVAILVGMLIQHNNHLFSTISTPQNDLNDVTRPVRTTDHPAPFDMEAAYKEMSEKLKKEILESINTEKKDANFNDNKPAQIKDDKLSESELLEQDRRKKEEAEAIKREKKQQDKKQNEELQHKTVIDTQIVKEKETSEIKITKNNEQIIIDANKIKESEQLEQDKRKQEEAIKREKKKDKKRSEEVKNKNVPEEVKSFKSKKISQMKPKKMWIPIPNSNGGHRRVPAVEVKTSKEHKSSVKVWLYEEFLSQDECENLIKVHESHLSELLKQRPIICFDNIGTLRKNLMELNKENVTDLVTPLDFTEGTSCLNQSMSRQLEKWGLKWSFSTAFYPGESKFATLFGKRIEEATQLNETHGGKFQITSYPNQVGYKDHTDCIVDSDEERDRYATFLVYLNDLGADGGGKTIFSELGIDVMPRQGRALTWNNMDYNTGKCEPKSTHSANKVEHITKKKYIIQRWYYLKNFYALGKRTNEALLPQRAPNTPKVTCDDYDHGSCRLYDEWNPDHMLEYKNNPNKL